MHRKKINILGLNCIAYDSSACLVQDGQLIAAFEEERLNRQKYTGVFPKEAIARCLTLGGIELKDIDYITLNWNPWTGTINRAWNAISRSPLSLFGVGVPSGRASLKKWFEILGLAKSFEQHFQVPASAIKPKIRYIHHHLAHAASSYFVSGFERAAFLSLDGAGEWVTTMLGVGENNRLRVLETINFPHSVGYLYQTITEFLGFGLGGEGKVMGLAAHGENRFANEFSKLYTVLPQGKFRLNLRYFSFRSPDALQNYSQAMVDLLGPARREDEPVEQRHQDIAASLQAATEEIALHLARHLYEITHIPSICLSGGVALNCVMNGKILAKLPFEEIFVQPAAGDAGGSVGGAYFQYHHVLGNPLCYRLRHAYLGDAFGEEEIVHAASAFNVNLRRMQDTEKETARLIAEGRIIGWFQGRMEFGPRALGNRSILADPRDASMRERINIAVKRRELFRPFAPAVLVEEASRCFEMKVKESPFMLLTFPVRAEWKDRVPAITHEDGSARVQTVTQQSNPRFWTLIHEFKNLTGVPMVLNTSFNDRDEPIVATPAHALNCFMQTDLDDLVLGDFHITRR